MRAGHNPKSKLKEDRLTQIEAYIGACEAMRDSYGSAMSAFLKNTSNLYAIQLRFATHDTTSRVDNPVFSIDRTNDACGVPASALYHAMHSMFPDVAIARRDPRLRTPTPLFYGIPAGVPMDERQDRLAFMTQFFLADLNVYCKSHELSTKNFGRVLDKSPDFSREFVTVVSTALRAGDDVESEICTFCNVNADRFGLSRSLNADDVAAVKKTFERTYRMLTEEKDPPPMNDFMILDKDAVGEHAKFVTHQGAICVDFSDIVDPVSASTHRDYFASIRADFKELPVEIPDRNESVTGVIELDTATLLATINDEQFQKLSESVKDQCSWHPSFEARRFLLDVCNGNEPIEIAHGG